MENNYNNTQDIINKNFERMEEETNFNMTDNSKNMFNILSIQKEMEIENIFLTNQNIKDLQNLNSGNVTVEELVSKAFSELSEL